MRTKNVIAQSEDLTERYKYVYTYTDQHGN